MGERWRGLPTLLPHPHPHCATTPVVHSPQGEAGAWPLRFTKGWGVFQGSGREVEGLAHPAAPARAPRLTRTPIKTPAVPVGFPTPPPCYYPRCACPSGRGGGVATKIYQGMGGVSGRGGRGRRCGGWRSGMRAPPPQAGEAGAWPLRFTKGWGVFQGSGREVEGLAYPAATPAPPPCYYPRCACPSGRGGGGVATKIYQGMGGVSGRGGRGRRCGGWRSGMRAPPPQGEAGAWPLRFTKGWGVFQGSGGERGD